MRDWAGVGCWFSRHRNARTLLWRSSTSNTPSMFVYLCPVLLLNLRATWPPKNSTKRNDLPRPQVGKTHPTPPLPPTRSAHSPPRQIQAFPGQAGGGGGHGRGAGKEHRDVRHGEGAAREERSASEVFVQAGQVLLRKRGGEVQPGVDLTGRRDHAPTGDRRGGGGEKKAKGWVGG